MDQTSQIFAALADPTRREILSMLKSEDLKAGDVAARIGRESRTDIGLLDDLFRFGARHLGEVVHVLRARAAELAAFVAVHARPILVTGRLDVKFHVPFSRFACPTARCCRAYTHLGEFGDVVRPDRCGQ